MNMRLFLEELRKNGPKSRADLTRLTGVAPPTTSSIVAALLETGLVEEVSLRESGGSRAGKAFRLATHSAYVVAAAVDPFEIIMAPAALDGTIRDSNRSVCPVPGSYDDLLDLLVDRTREIVEQSPGRCVGLGIAVPGLVNERAGRVALSPNLHFTDGRSIGPDLEERLGIRVVCSQELHALSLAEIYVGEGRDLSDFVILDVTSGLGIGIVSNGNYLSGHRGFAGEMGHTTVDPNGRLCGCGNRGCLETVATDTSFLNSIRERIGEKIGFEDVVTRVESGELDVSRELETTLEYLSIALANVINVFDPEAVILHGRLFDLGPDVLKILSEQAVKRALAPAVEDLCLYRGHGEKLYGAAAGLLDRLFDEIGPRLD